MTRFLKYHDDEDCHKTRVQSSQKEAALGIPQKKACLYKSTMSNISPTVQALITSMWNGTAAPSAVPSIAPSAPPPSPVDTTYYAPSASQVILYVVITTIIIVGISLLNRCVVISFGDSFGYQCKYYGATLEMQSRS